MCSDISSLLYLTHEFKTIYTMVFGKDLLHTFIDAHKYEKLTVLKQFTPFYKITPDSSEIDKRVFRGYLTEHQKKYGNNQMIDSSRVPSNDYIVVDKGYVQTVCKCYSAEAIVDVLFALWHDNLGYIDPIEDKQETESGTTVGD